MSKHNTIQYSRKRDVKRIENQENQQMILKDEPPPPWPEFASELYRPSDRRLLTKLVLTFADRVCHVVSVTDPYGCILGFLERILKDG
jgi:hypothetical protein